MSTLVDPHICPDCRAPLDATATCTRCGLRLAGPVAADLWACMQEADRLVEQLRADSLVPQPAMSTAAPAPSGSAPLPTAPPAPPGELRTRTLPGASVPVVLLALGGLCLLVAAIVFVAVAWSSLGLAAKTLILLTVTGLFAAAAVAVTRRDLRFATETLWLVVAGLVAVDLGAAYGADLFGLSALGDRGAVALVGAALLALAVGVGAWATGTAVGRIHGLVGVAAIGTLLLAGAEAWTSEDNPLAVAVSVPVLVLLAWGIDRGTDRHLRPTAAVVGSAAVVSWLVLLGHGIDRMATTDSDRAWWSELPGWPLLVAAALAAVPAALSRVPGWARYIAAGGSLVALSLLVAGPSTGPTADLLAWAGVSALVALVAALAPTVWARPAAALSALGLVVWSVLVLDRPLEVIGKLPTTADPARGRLDLSLPTPDGGPSAWTSIVAVLVVGALAFGLLRHLPDAARDAAGRILVALGPVVLALGGATWILETEPTLLTAVLVWSGALIVATVAAATVRHHHLTLAAGLGFAAYLLVVGLRLATPSHPLSAGLATAAGLVLAVGYARARADQLFGALLPVLAASAVVTSAIAALHWPYVAGGRSDAAGTTLAVVAALVLTFARLAGRDETSRRTLELTALVVGLAAAAIPTHDPVVAVVLTIVGSAVALVAVLEHDREPASWLAVALLGVATVIRVDADVRFPELVTLPAAALLLAAGGWRLGRDAGESSVRTLASGLTLGLVPSLLLSLDEPVTLRGALVAAAGLVALAVGTTRRWAAPFVAGALTTGVLAVRHLGPVVDGLPRWISLGTVGVLLLLVGVTWEQRRRDVAVAERYLASLR